MTRLIPWSCLFYRSVEKGHIVFVVYLGEGKTITHCVLDESCGKYCINIPTQIQNSPKKLKSVFLIGPSYPPPQAPWDFLVWRKGGLLVEWLCPDHI